VAAATAVRSRGSGDEVTIVPRSGIPLEVRFESSGEVVLRGDARMVFEGQLAPEAIRWA
jgi:diaminopimelate epimerase